VQSRNNGRLCELRPGSRANKADGTSSQEYERMRMERDLLKKAASSLPASSEVQVHCASPQYLAHTHDVPGYERIDQRFL
jgi:hypothetical protein